MQRTTLTALAVSTLFLSVACNDPNTTDAAAAQERGSYVELQGLSMYYEEHGQGEPLVLLHGGLQTIELSFGELLPLLATNHRVIAVEQQGHGHTSDAERPMSYEQMADDTAALLRAIGVEQTDVLGFSQGGSVALHMALRHPQQIRKLVIASTVYNNDGWRPELRALQNGEAPTPADADWLPTAADFAEMEAAYRQSSPDPEAWPVVMEKANRVVSEFKGIAPEQVSGIRHPALVVVGDNDFVTLEHAAALSRLLPDGRLAVLPDTTHVEVTTKAAQLKPLLVDFLATPTASPPASGP